MKRVNAALDSAFFEGFASFVIGTTLMAFGACLAVLAVWRYHVVNRAIEHGEVKADRWLVILVAALVVFISAGMISFIKSQTLSV